MPNIKVSPSGWARIALFSLALLGIGCDPCRTLGEKICSCLNELEKEQCIRDLNDASSHIKFKASGNEAQCTKALKTCGNCKKILAGDYEDCGLTRP